MLSTRNKIMSLAAVPASITSAIIVVIRNAVDSLSARRGAVPPSISTVPSPSSTRRINVGVGTSP